MISNQCTYDEIIQKLLVNINELKLENTIMKQDIIELKNINTKQYIDNYKIPVNINSEKFYFDNTETILDLQYIYTDWKRDSADIWIQLNKFNYLETIIVSFFSGISLCSCNNDFSYFLLNKELIITYNNTFDRKNTNLNENYIIHRIRDLNRVLDINNPSTNSILERMIRLKKIKLINITAYDPNIKNLLEDLQKYCDSRFIDLIIS